MGSRRRRKKNTSIQLINPLAKCESCIFYTVSVIGGYCFRRNKRVSSEAPACKYYLEDKHYLEASTPIKPSKRPRGVTNRIVVLDLSGSEESGQAPMISLASSEGSEVVEQT